jgi:hypothetical protein
VSQVLYSFRISYTRTNFDMPKSSNTADIKQDTTVIRDGIDSLGDILREMDVNKTSNITERSGSGAIGKEANESNQSGPSVKANVSNGQPVQLGHDYWLELFRSCGVETSQSERYARTFVEAGLGPSRLPSAKATLFRTMGLAEEDIAKVMRHLDNVFTRQEAQAGISLHQNVSIPEELTPSEGFTSLARPATPGTILSIVNPIRQPSPRTQVIRGRTEDHGSYLPLLPLRPRQNPRSRRATGDWPGDFINSHSRSSQTIATSEREIRKNWGDLEEEDRDLRGELEGNIRWRGFGRNWGGLGGDGRGRRGNFIRSRSRSHSVVTRRESQVGGDWGDLEEDDREWMGISSRSLFERSLPAMASREIEFGGNWRDIEDDRDWRRDCSRYQSDALLPGEIIRERVTLRETRTWNNSEEDRRRREDDRWDLKMDLF